MNYKISEVANIINRGGIGVFPTDTIYGLIGSALIPQAVKKIYRVRKRDSDKPFIILISDISDLERFGVNLKENILKKLYKSWPEKTSIIFECTSSKFAYLHRNQNSLAFRLPRQKPVSDLLNETGPLVAPSANPQGLEPAANIEEAKTYFSDSIDFYFDAGEISSKPSTVLKLEGEDFITVRK